MYNICMSASHCTMVRVCQALLEVQQPINSKIDLPTSLCVSLQQIYVCTAVMCTCVDDSNRIVLAPVGDCTDEYINASPIDVSSTPCVCDSCYKLLLLYPCKKKKLAYASFKKQVVDQVWWPR